MYQNETIMNSYISESYVLQQLDGNQTLYSSTVSSVNCSCCLAETECGKSSSYESFVEIPYPIPVIQIATSKHVSTTAAITPPVWYEEFIPRRDKFRDTKSNLINVKRDNRHLIGEFLPSISVSNMRSLIPKIQNFKVDVLEREISVALLSEVWEKAGCKKQKHEVEKMFQMDGLKYISTPRTYKRGGGAAIVVNLEHFSLEKLDVVIPNKLEIVWGLVRPKVKVSSIKEIIVVAFYAPPKSKKNELLLVIRTIWTYLYSQQEFHI